MYTRNTEYFNRRNEALFLGTQPISDKYFNLMFVGPCIIVITEEQKPTRCHLLLYCTSYRLNMFRALLCPSSGAREYNADYHIGRFVLGLLYAGG